MPTPNQSNEANGPIAMQFQRASRLSQSEHVRRYQTALPRNNEISIDRNIAALVKEGRVEM